MIICLYHQHSMERWELPQDSKESFVLLCPWCGDCWARVLGLNTQWWRNVFIPCIRHPEAAKAYGCYIGGSLLELFELDLLDKLPDPLITREFNITMRIPDEC